MPKVSIYNITNKLITEYMVRMYEELCFSLFSLSLLFSF